MSEVLDSLNVVSYPTVSNTSEAGFWVTFEDVVGNWDDRSSETRSRLILEPFCLFLQSADSPLFETEILDVQCSSRSKWQIKNVFHVIHRQLLGKVQMLNVIFTRPLLPEGSSLQVEILSVCLFVYLFVRHHFNISNLGSSNHRKVMPDPTHYASLERCLTSAMAMTKTHANTNTKTKTKTMTITIC